jgi:hypothetical protein
MPEKSSNSTPSMKEMFKKAYGFGGGSFNSSSQTTDGTRNEIIKPSKVITEWAAAERFFSTKSREFYRKMSIIIIFIALLLIIIKEFMLVIVLAVLFFVVYVFHTVPPRTVKHQITTNGVNYASETLYSWNELSGFFINKVDNTYVLNINTRAPIPGRLIMILSEEVNVHELSKIINEYISIIEVIEEEPLEKVRGLLSKTFKFE